MAPTHMLPWTPRWHRSFTGFFLPYHSPLIRDGQLIVRMGEEVVTLDPDDGSTLWEILLEEHTGDGSFFVGEHDWLAAEIRRRPERLSSVIGLGVDGRRRWRTDLDVQILTYAALVHRARVVFLGSSEAASLLFRLEPGNGHVELRRPLPFPGSDVLALGDELLIRSQFGEAGRPGLYTVDAEGELCRKVCHEMVWRFVASEHAESGAQRVVTTSQQDLDSPLYLRVWDENLEEQWRTPSAYRSAACTADTVFHIDQRDGVEHLVGRELDSGEERWHAELPADAQGEHSRIWAAGPWVGCQRVLGLDLYDAGDGAYLGHAPNGWTPPLIVDDRSYWLGGEEDLVCVDLVD